MHSWAAEHTAKISHEGLFFWRSSIPIPTARPMDAPIAIAGIKAPAGTFKPKVNICMGQDSPTEELDQLQSPDGYDQK